MSGAVVCQHEINHLCSTMFHKQQHPTNKQWNRNQQNKNNGIGISKTKTME
jgi:peptide deformylase